MLAGFPGLGFSDKGHLNEQQEAVRRHCHKSRLEILKAEGKNHLSVCKQKGLGVFWVAPLTVGACLYERIRTGFYVS